MDPDEIASERLSAGVWDVDPRFRTAVEALQDGLVVYSSIRNDQGEIVDFKCEYANKASAENRGVQPEEQVGRRLRDIFPGVRRDGLLDHYIDVVETGVPLTLDRGTGWEDGGPLIVPNPPSSTIGGHGDVAQSG